MPESWRPTLYDFIAHEALEFYTSGEQAAAKAAGRLRVGGGQPDFLAGAGISWIGWTGWRATPIAPAVKALRLYRDLLRFHQSDPAPRLAFAAADLERLTWGWNAAFGEEKNAALQDRAGSIHPRQCRFRHLRFCHGKRSARDSAGRRFGCGARTGRARRRSLSELTRREALPQSRLSKSKPNRRASPPSASGTRRGRKSPFATEMWTSVYFRAIPMDWEMFLHQILNRNSFSPQNMNEKERREFLAKAPALAWSAKLPPTADFKEKTFEVDAPETLEAGLLLHRRQPRRGISAKGTTSFR